ncbi:uncharacterized protein N7515_009627 [Penicillium bovifimosum]|uniref:Uncharacterized protein n=1 Tax=Penicillium bovifimosum TaxID=126998 RepID=A0A9W9GJZ3_9EURO|nr:uncharacterized protein N7515_009627 [Penicillium bovifimosum]KAJ5121666.1 hypothetical protein N7515_009627 [Penicillium bovifimosum]
MTSNLLPSRTLLDVTLTRQLRIPSARYLSTTSLRPSKAEDPEKSKPKQEQSDQTSKTTAPTDGNKRHTLPPKPQTVSQADAELRERLEQMSGEGGASGIEYEDGKANAMKRGVRNNMFRVI